MRTGFVLILCAILLIPPFCLPSPVSALNFSLDSKLSNANASFLGGDGEESGISVSSAGDVNGDGYDDFLIGARSSSQHGSLSGQAYLIFGKSTGWSRNVDLSNADASFYGEQPGDEAGSCVGGVGDVNGDGYDDFVIGSYYNDEGGNNAGQTYLFFGKPSGWARNTNVNTSNASFWGTDAGDETTGCSYIGDVNGDGYNDLTMDAWLGSGASQKDGVVYLVFGKSTGWANDTNLTKADATFHGEKVGDEAEGCSGAGDVNNDGYDDLLCSSTRNDEAANDAGQTYLFFGKAKGWKLYTSFSKANASFWGENTNDQIFGCGGIGDVNGDGYDDFMIGSYYNSENGANAGQSYLIFGRKSGWAMDTSISNANASFLGEYAHDWAFVDSAAGDVNGDGYDDFLIGARQNSEMDTYAGQTYLFLGSPSGWTMDTNVSKANASFWGENGHTLSGSHVDTAGDVNGDGYDDIVIGAFDTDQTYINQGKTFLVFPDSNIKASSVTSVKAFSDGSFSNEISKSLVNKTIFIELKGTDGDANKVNTMTVQVSSNKSFSMGFPLRLRETGKNTGVFRGNFTIENVTSKRWDWINATDGEIVNVSSVQDKTKYTTIRVGVRSQIWPSSDNIYATEDQPYKTHYWSVHKNDQWTFKSNASWLIWNPNTHNITGLPNNADIGTYYVIINITNIDWGTDEHKFNLTVNNTPPMISTTPATGVDQDQLYRVNFNSSDDGQGKITWHLGTKLKWLSMNSTTGNLSGIPRNEDVGKYLINVSVDDGNGGSDWKNYTLMVVNINDPPVITTKDVTTAYEDQKYYVDYNVTDPDKTDSTFTWTLQTNATWLSVTKYAGVLIGTPSNAEVGNYYVVVTVADPIGGTDEHHFSLIVINVNDPPTWVDVPKDSTIHDLDICRFDINATDIDVKDVLTYNISSTPASLIGINRSTGLIEWKPERIGTFRINVSVTDGNVTIYHEFNLTVNYSLNVPRTILKGPMDGLSISLLNPKLDWDIMFEGNYSRVTSDLYLSKDRSKVQGLDASARIARSLNDNVFTVIVPLEKSTTYYWTVIPYNGTIMGNCISGIWSFNESVDAELNSLPYITSRPSLVTGINVPWIYMPMAKDNDTGDTIWLVLRSGPTGMKFDGTTLRWTPRNIGFYTVTLEAHDGKGSTYQVFTIEVTLNVINHAPTINPITNMTIVAGELLSVQVLASDQDKDALNYSFSGGPGGAKIDKNGLLTWQSNKGDEGTYPITVKVSDGKSTTTTSFILTVKKARATKTWMDSYGLALVGILIAIMAVIAAVIIFMRLKRKKPS